MAWRIQKYTVHGAIKSWTQLSDFDFSLFKSQRSGQGGGVERPWAHLLSQAHKNYNYL